MTCCKPLNLALNKMRQSHSYGPSSSSSRNVRLILMALLSTLVVIAIVLFVNLYTSSSLAFINYLGTHTSQQPLGIYRNAAISTDGPGCAKYGRKLLERNGTAMDAVISVLLCMGVVIPESMGLGGGVFIVYYKRDEKKTWVIDGREKASSSVTTNMFHKSGQESAWGGKSIAVPGELSAYHEAHKRFGKLNWTELFEGAIDISTKGFPVHEHLGDTIRTTLHIFNGTYIEKIFINPETGKYYYFDEIMKRPDLAATFKLLATKGVDEFYRGEMAKNLVREIRDAGGIINEQDFASYQANVYEAENYTLPNGINLFSVDPPGSGPVLGFMLNVILRTNSLTPEIGKSFDDSVDYYHRFVEIWKHAYALRSKLEDRAFGRIENVISSLRSDEYAKEIADKINLDQTYLPSYYGVDVGVTEDHGTSHVSVIDKYGNAASASSTINQYFGSGIASPSTGIIFNDEMDDFSSPNIINLFGVVPSSFNTIEPGKRPLSSMVPSILVNASSGDVLMAIGASGGTKITTSVASTIVRTLFLGDDVKSAVDAFRIHHQLLPNVIQYETGFPENILTELRTKGHETKTIVGRSSVVMAIARDTNGNLTANSDWRKGGDIDGY